MKARVKLYFGILFFFSTVTIQAQTKSQWAIWKEREAIGESDTSFYKKDFKDKYCHYNFSNIWTQTENLSVLGFIGNNYQRLRIKFLSVLKDSAYPDIYFVIGKSMVKDSVRSFKGEIIITNIRIYKDFQYGDAQKYTKAQIAKKGVIFGNYYFSEDSTQTKTGIFKGSFASCWFIDNQGRLKYDDDAGVSDSYCNNQFTGIWQSYKSQIKETCNWGDYRIPFSGKFDWGAGDFSADTAYLKYGWKDYYDLTIKTGNDTEYKKAEKDAEKWWK